MKIKTNELTGAALDWAVAKCEGYRVRRNPFSGTVYDNFDNFYWVDYHDGKEVVRDLGWIRPGYQSDYSPSTEWHQGGLIIEREKISIEIKSHGYWIASYQYNYLDEKEFLILGDTPLIAAMRCYVTNKLGNEVDVPDCLL